MLRCSRWGMLQRRARPPEMKKFLTLFTGGKHRTPPVVNRGNVYSGRLGCAESGSVGVLAALSGVGLPVVSLSRDFIGCVPCVALVGFGVFLGRRYGYLVYVARR